MADRDVSELLGDRPASAVAANDRSIDELLGPAPKPESSVAGATWRNFAHGATMGFSPQIVGAGDAVAGLFSGKPIGATFEASRDARRAQLAEDAKEHPTISTLADIGGSLASLRGVGMGKGVLGAAKTGAAMGGTRAFADSTAPLNTERELGETALGAGLGAAFGGAGGLVARGIGSLAQRLLPRAQAFEQRAASAMADKASAAAEATAKSARGSLGSATAEGSRTLERLGMTEGLPTAEQAANRMVLSQPESEALATTLAQKARAKLPDQLAHIQGAEALAQQTAADAAQARVQGATVDYAKDALKSRVTEQAKRYAIPLAAGAIGGLTGDDEGFNWAHAGVGALAGRGVSPTARALMSTVTHPATQRLVGAGFRSMAERMASLAQTSPEIAGKFGPVLLNASHRGPDALAVAHYTLSQQPDYQELQRIASKGSDQ